MTTISASPLTDEQMQERSPARDRIAAKLIGLALGIAISAPSSVFAATGLPPALGTVAVPGATIIGTQWVTNRTLQLTVDTDTFLAPQPVEVTFPTNYNANTTIRWPVTFYLGGFNHDETVFRSYDGEAVTASYGSIIVTPRGGVGYWNDWYNNGAGGPPKYETFVVKQLIPLIDANYRTLGDRAHRAIMGESGGGYGVLLYAAKYPQLFVAAASLSGTPDITGPAGQAVFPVAPTLDGGLPNAIHGPWLTDEVRWRGNNPADLAGNLIGIDLQMFIGSGIPSLLYGESAAETTGGCALEGGIVRPTSMTMHQDLINLGIPHAWTDIPWGCHSVALFRYEISQAIPRFAQLFANPTAAPANFDYRAIAPSFSVWGWDFTTDTARALEFLDLHNVTRTGLTLTGSGKTTVTTPPFFKGSKPVTVTMNGLQTTATPDKNGRISFAVDLGLADTQQQYTVGAVTTMSTVVVQFN